jgi:aspartate aminotransferase
MIRNLKMSDGLVTQRMTRIHQSMETFVDFFTNPRLSAWQSDPLGSDFLTGNSQEMPLPGFVDTLRRWIEPQSKDWFSYKMSEPEARAAIAGNLRLRRGVDYQDQDIFLTPGAFGALAVTLNTLLEQGDEVIYISPPWFFYETLIVAAGGKPVSVRANPMTFDLDLEMISNAVTPRTRAIIINSPNNPTGRIYTPETLEALGDLLIRAQKRTGRPIFLISDESYNRIIYDGRTYSSPTTFYPYSFMIYTYGKTLLAPGQRIGYIALPPEMPDRETLRNLIFMTQLAMGYAFPNALLQYAIPDLEKLSIDVEHLQYKRDWMVKELRKTGYELHSPEGTFYLLPRSPLEDDNAFVDLLAEQHIYCLPGSMMEMPGYFRISLTASDEMIRRALPGFTAALEKAQQVISELGD